MSLQPISATSAYLILPSQVISICDLQRLALYWFHAPGLHNWTTKFCSQQTSHMEPSATSTMVTGPVGEYLQVSTKDAPVLDCLAPLRHLHDSGARYKYPDLLTWVRKIYRLKMCGTECLSYQRLVADVVMVSMCHDGADSPVRQAITTYSSCRSYEIHIQNNLCMFAEDILTCFLHLGHDMSRCSHVFSLWVHNQFG